ncbi:MAG: site-2 protease family protein [Chloroflexi bacterium]|nr:site-2 protease family protein [Chloroflexota bacterium]
MKFGNAFTLGKLFGIEFRIHFTWFIIFILVTSSLVYPDYSRWQNWIIGIITSLLFFASVVGHELAHSLVGRAQGIPIQSITLFIFGGVAQMTQEATRPGAELKMAAAGPLTSLVLGGFFGLLWFLFPGKSEPVGVMILWLAVMNGALAVFNLVPGFPLDGGRVFRSILWYLTGSYRRATLIATRVGQSVGYLFILGGISIILLRLFGLSLLDALSWFDGVWFIFIGWFLSSIALSSYRQIPWQEPLHDPALLVSPTDRLVPPGGPDS